LDNWDEVRTAFQVARCGTVSGAAEALGVHHATVIRHIDALEQRLGVKLFQRHARGYTATEAGQDLFLVAQATDDQFTQLAGRIKGRGEGVTGELVVTSLPTLTNRLVPVLADFQREHPGLIVRFLTGARLFRLEYGEAHVAIRAGARPEDPDNVVQELMIQPMAMAASKAYIKRHGQPASVDDLEGHVFVGTDGQENRAPFYRWLAERVSRERVVFRANDDRGLAAGVRAGAGIGFMPVDKIKEEDDLVQVIDPIDEWGSPIWIVTHVDLHRSPKVQSFLRALKSAAKSWS
jgi:DNA-binding transcriptional LysR family regulator